MYLNGTAVPDGITFRLFPTNFGAYKFGGAGGWAFQSVVTRLRITGLRLRRQSNQRLLVFRKIAHDALDALAAVCQLALVVVKRRFDFVLRFLL
jgi:hypothetical protein